MNIGALSESNFLNVGLQNIGLKMLFSWYLWSPSHKKYMPTNLKGLLGVMEVCVKWHRQLAIVFQCWSAVQNNCPAVWQ
jgi:hypothetical protein